MRRVFVTALCAASFLFVLPAPAHAWFDWIDQLSGPGPFIGFDLQWRLVCVQDSDPAVREAPDPKDPGPTGLRKLDSFGTGAARVFAGIAGAGCVFQPQVNPESSFNFRVARLWSTDNHLQYASGVEAPTVNMWQLEPSFSTFVDDKKLLELTVGMGLSVLSGDGFDSISRFYFKPVTLTFTPGGRLSRRTNGDTSITKKFARALSVSTGVFYMPKGFDAGDFGAVPGTFHTDRELLATAAVTFDLSRF
jgi:hypothetical protein